MGIRGGLCIAAALVVYLLVNVLKEPGKMAPETRAFAPGTFLPLMHEMLGAVGISVSRTPLNLSALLAVLAGYVDAAACGVMVKELQISSFPR